MKKELYELLSDDAKLIYDEFAESHARMMEKLQQIEELLMTIIAEANN